MDLKNRIKNLAGSTASKEVKELCQKYLNESEGSGIDKDVLLTESLFVDLKKAAANDNLVAELLSETDSYAVNKRKIEAKISGRTAQQLMENWNGPKNVSPVGNLKDNTLETENQKRSDATKALHEGLVLAAKTDSSAGRVLKDLRVESYGIAEAIQTIKTSKIMSTPQLKYAIARFDAHIANNVSESRFVKEFLSNIAGFAWDPTVSEAYSTVKTLADAKSVEIEVQNAIHTIAEHDQKNFFGTAIQSLNTWLMNENRSIPGLVKDMKQWMFNPAVSNLVKHVQILENSYGNKFNVTVNSSNCSINKIYSPINMVAEGTVFRAGDAYYLSSTEGIARLSEAQINGLPIEYTNLCANFFNNAVRVSDEGVHVYIGSTKVTMNEDGTFIGESAIDPADLGQKLLFHTQKTMFKSDNGLIAVAVKLQENLNKIVEVDYGKAVFSNLYEGVGVYLFRKNDKLYINKVNPAMNENSFSEANAVQTVTAVKEFLNYDLSESLIDMLDGDLKKKSLMESAMNDVLNNIELVEAEINKIEEAIMQNADLADVAEIKAAAEMLESELNKLKSEWHTKSAELEKFVTIMEKEEEEEEEEEETPQTCDKCGSEECICDNNDDDDDTPPTDDTPPSAEEEDENAVSDEDEDDETESEKKNDVADAIEADSTIIDAEEEVPTDLPAEEVPTDEVPTEEVPTEEVPTEEVPTDLPAEEEIPTEDVIAPAGDEMTDAGLAGAEGAQTQTQEIAGNDHADALASDAITSDALVADGHAGADNAQTQAASIPNAANAMAVAPTGEEAEITIPSNIETASIEQQQNTSSVEVGDTAADAVGDADADADADTDLPAEDTTVADDAAGEPPVDAEDDATMDDESTVDQEADAEVEPLPDNNDEEEEKSNEKLNNYLTSKGLNEEEIATISGYIGKGSLAAKLHNGSPKLMAKVMPFVKEITNIIQESGAKKVGTTLVTREDFVATVNEAFNGTTAGMANRLITAFDNLDVSQPSRVYNMAMHESVAGDVTGRDVIEITHKAVGKLAYYNQTSKFDAVLDSMESVIEKKKPKLNEALDVNVSVCMKGSDKKGVITAINSAEQQYTVIWDGGETGDYGQDQLEELSADIADNDNENKLAAEDATKKSQDASETPMSNVSGTTNEGFEHRAAINDTFDPEGLKKKIDEYIFANFVKGNPTPEHADRISATYGDIVFDLKTLQIENVGESIEELATELTEDVDVVADALTKVLKANAKLVDDRMSESQKKTEAVTESNADDAETEDDLSVWTKAKVKIDFGPFTEGELVDIDASQFVSSGDDDSIKLKTPKDEINSIPKKYLDVENEGNDTHTEISGKLEDALKSLEAAETLIKSDDKIDKQEISDAVGKVKAFKDALKGK